MAKLKRRPLGVISFYGPDDARATKLVVSIVKHSPDEEPEAIYRWTVEQGDIRENTAIAAELKAMMSRHRVKHVQTAPHILGCPHEEGIDYPLGRTCPQCPFWATVERWVNKPLEAPAASMSVEEVLAELSRPDPIDPPFEALTSADAHRATLTEPLLELLTRCLDSPRPAGDSQLPADSPERVAEAGEPGAGHPSSMLAQYGLYLLAKWRETRAYPLVVRWLSLPGDEALSVFDDDVLMDDGARILASVCDGGLAPIQALALNREANEWCRAAAVRALALLGAWAEVPGEQIVAWFVWLADEGLEREPSEVWNELAASSVEIEAVPVFKALRQAYDEHLIDATLLPPGELDAVEAAEPGERLSQTQEVNRPFDDLGADISGWVRFNIDPSDDDLDDDPGDWPDDGWDDDEPDREDWESGGPSTIGEVSRVLPQVETHRVPQKVGRNEPCPCGSGQKFKKCCGA